MARLYCGLHTPAALPLELLSDTENEKNDYAKIRKPQIWLKNWK